MPVIKDLIEAAAVKIAGFRRCRLGSHRKTPAFGGSAPRSRHFTMLREDQESSSLNDLWVVQGRLLTADPPGDRCSPEGLPRAGNDSFRDIVQRPAPTGRGLPMEALRE